MAATSNPAAAALSTGPVTIRFDGSVLDSTHHDNPSAAVGYVVEETMASTTVIKASRSLDYWVSNTHVEFDAMIAALDHLLDLGYTGHVNVCGDCQSIIELADPTCDPTPNTRLMTLYVQRARARLDQFDSYTLNYVRRKNNRVADELATIGHDCQAIS